MARFRATIHGNRGLASRIGTAKSGIVANINGWNVGVCVEIVDKDGQDVIYINRTGGSNDLRHYELIGKIEGKSG